MRMCRKARRQRFTVEVGLKRPFTSIRARDGREPSWGSTPRLAPEFRRRIGAMKTRMQSLIGLGLALVAASGATAADKPVFGLVMSFSGWFQPIDADTIAGAKLAVDDINASGGVLGQPIEIVQFDNKSDPPLGADGA